MDADRRKHEGHRIVSLLLTKITTKDGNDGTKKNEDDDSIVENRGPPRAASFHCSYHQSHQSSIDSTKQGELISNEQSNPEVMQTDQRLLGSTTKFVTRFTRQDQSSLMYFSFRPVIHRQNSTMYDDSKIDRGDLYTHCPSDIHVGYNRQRTVAKAKQS